MHIAIVAGEILPVSKASRRAADVACLASEFVALGHVVSAVAPLPPEANPTALSLARRLTPVAVDHGGSSIEFVRYDGRTPSGVDLHLLALEPSGAAALALSDGDPNDAIAKGALTLLRGLTDRPCCCLGWDALAAPLAALDRGPAFGAPGMKHIAIFSEEIPERDLEGGALADADRIVALEWENAAETAPAPLRAELSCGRAVVLPRPATTSLRPAADKASAKASFQLRAGLPVRPGVPLVAFRCSGDAAAAGALGQFLTGDVQVIAEAGSADIAALAARYPDRLFPLPAGEPLDAALAAVDGCVAGNDTDLACQSLAAGAVPIVGPELRGVLVDLETSLASGSAIVVGSWREASLKAALARLVAATASGPAFLALSSRLPAYAPRWLETASRIAQLCELALFEPR